MRLATPSLAAHTSTGASDSASSGGISPGWGFVVGKTASCAATALIVGFYAWPAQAHAIAVVAVLALTALNFTGIQKSALATRIIVAVVLAALAAIAVIALTAPGTDFGRLDIGADASARGVLQGAGSALFRVRRLRADRDPG